jgi:hypothetical protein
MDKHFEYYFPPDIYRPLDLISSTIETPEQSVIITRFRHNQSNDVFAYKCTKLSRTSDYSRIVSDENNICASITVPMGRIVDIVKHCNDVDEDSIASFCGPVHVVLVRNPDDENDTSILSQNCYIRNRDIVPTPDMIAELNQELLDCQKKMVVRLYFKPLFNNFMFSKEKHSDIPIGVVLEYPNMLRYNSMIIPYGLFMDTASELVVAPRPSSAGNYFQVKWDTGKLYGPYLVSDTTQMHVYYPQSAIHSMIEYKLDDIQQYEHIPLTNIQTHISSILRKVPVPLVSISHMRVKPKVRVSHYIYKNLKPFFDMCILSEALGADMTLRIKQDVGFEPSPDEIERLVLFWLIKKNGDYSYITPLFNKPLFNRECQQALTKYTRNVTKGEIEL